MAHNLRCPACGTDVASRSALWGRRRSDGVPCDSCGERVRIKPWVVRAIDGVAAAAVVPALVLAVVFWSVIPFLIFVGVVAAAYCAAYWGIPHLLQSRRGAS